MMRSVTYFEECSNKVHFDFMSKSYEKTDTSGLIKNLYQLLLNSNLGKLSH